MDGFKIGDIVQPKTGVRRDEYGQGIVIAITVKHKTMVTVVFPSCKGSMTARNFLEVSLQKVRVKPHLLEKIEQAGATYLQIQKELKIA